MKYSCIVFDVDGTLVDNELSLFTTWQQTIEQLFGIHYEIAELGFAMGVPGEVTMKRMGAADPKAAFEVWMQNYQGHKSQITLFPGIEEMLDGLQRQGVRLGIVTSRNRAEVAHNDNVLPPLLKRFGAVVCFEDTVRHKPEAEPLLTCLQRLQAQPREALYVGDSHYDAECAANAGVDFGLALWNLQKNKEIPSTMAFSAPSDLCALF